MRILYLVHQFYPEYGSGTERVTLNLAKAAQRANNHVEILTCSVLPDARGRVTHASGWRQGTVDGIAVSSFPGDQVTDPYGFDFGVDARLREEVNRFLDKGRFDLVHVMHAMRLLDVVACIRNREIPYILTFTDFFTLCYRINLNRLSGELCGGPVEAEACRRYCSTGAISPEILDRRYQQMVDVLRSAEDRIACSSFVADVYRRELPGLQVRTIEHGIDLLKFRPRRDRPDRSLTFGFLGTLSKAKGVDVLVKAFTSAKAPDARLELVGDFHGNEIEPYVREMAQADHRITIYGPVDAAAVPTTLARFDVNCLPSIVPETYSLVLHEGFAAGSPALVSNIGNIGTTIHRHRCGQLVPVGDARAWQNSIEAIAARPEVIDEWRKRIPLPTRQEEECFLYSQIYIYAQRRLSRDLGSRPTD